MQRQQQRKRAFADATAGVVGSLAAMLAFYPVDVWKTSLQANTARSIQCKDKEDGASSSSNFSQNSGIMTTTTTLPSAAAISITITRLFRGLPYKIAHTIASSFTYWYVYSLLQTKYAAYQLHYHHAPSRTTIESSTKNDSSSSSSNSSSRPSTTKSSSSSVVTKLLLTAVAAMINTGITLPLDTISSRRQVALTLMNHDDDDDDGGDGESTSSKTRRRQDQPRRRLQQQTQQHLLQSILSLWNGLLPALMLCTNPAIQYTLYDTLKAAWLVRRRYRGQSGQFLRHQQEPVLSDNPKRRQHSLSMPEAFACGVISKFIATMITYPLIRCKVMLMVSPSHPTTRTAHSSSSSSLTGASTVSKDGIKDGCSTAPDNANQYGGCEECSRKIIICSGSDNARGGDRHEGRAAKYPRSLPLLLLHIYKHEGGFRGMYRGCSVQLLHTILKSAFLMMVRERITYASHRFFRIEE
jgi:hypothetical protein